MPERNPTELYGKILELGSHFSGYAGLRINSALARLQREHLRKELSGECSSVWSSPLVPSEILAAFGLISVTPETVAAVLASAGRGGGFLDAAGAAMLSGDCCSFQRVAAAALEAGTVPLPEAFLSTTPICDDNPQLGNYLGGRHGREHFLLDIPVDGGDAALSYTIGQLQEMIVFLEDLTGRALDAKRLAQAVRESNLTRRHWQEANRIRRENPPVMYGVAALRLAGGMLLQKLGLPELTEAMADYARELRERVAAGAFLPCRKRLLWLHLFPLYDGEFMRFVEKELGLVVVFEETSLPWWDEIDPADPLPGLARRISGSPLGDSTARRLAAVEKMSQDYGADGIVHFSHRGCRSLSGGAPFLARSLRRKGIPFLELSGDCLDNRSPAPATWKTRLEAFAEILG